MEILLSVHTVVLHSAVEYLALAVVMTFSKLSHGCPVPVLKLTIGTASVHSACGVTCKFSLTLIQLLTAGLCVTLKYVWRTSLHEKSETYGSLAVLRLCTYCFNTWHGCIVYFCLYFLLTTEPWRCSTWSTTCT